MRIRLEKPPTATRRRLDDIATATGIDPLEVDRWLVAISEEERRATLRSSAIVLSLCALGIALLFAVPKRWLGPDSIPTAQVLFGCALILVASAVADLLAQLRVRRWRRTSCRVLATAIRPQERFWVPVVFFEYEVEGRTRRASTVHVTGPRTGAEEADRHRKQYRAGARYNCYYNARRPTCAVLELGLSYRDARVFGGLALAAALAGLVF